MGALFENLTFRGVLAIGSSFAFLLSLLEAVCDGEAWWSNDLYRAARVIKLLRLPLVTLVLLIATQVLAFVRFGFRGLWCLAVFFALGVLCHCLENPVAWFIFDLTEAIKTHHRRIVGTIGYVLAAGLYLFVLHAASRVASEEISLSQHIQIVRPGCIVVAAYMLILTLAWICRGAVEWRKEHALSKSLALGAAVVIVGLSFGWLTLLIWGDPDLAWLRRQVDPASFRILISESTRIVCPGNARLSSTSNQPSVDGLFAPNGDGVLRWGQLSPRSALDKSTLPWGKMLAKVAVKKPDWGDKVFTNFPDSSIHLDVNVVCDLQLKSPAEVTGVLEMPLTYPSHVDGYRFVNNRSTVTAEMGTVALIPKKSDDLLTFAKFHHYAKGWWGFWLGLNFLTGCVFAYWTFIWLATSDD